MILTEDECFAALDDNITAIEETRACEEEWAVIVAMCRAIEAAVIAKLAQGVSVEPVIRGWMNPANGVVIDPQRKKQLGVGDGYPNFSVPLYDESGTVTSKQLRTCIAAARVKALELSDDEIDALLPTITLKGLDPKQQVWLTKKDAIAFARAIIAAAPQPKEKQ